MKKVDFISFRKTFAVIVIALALPVAVFLANNKTNFLQKAFGTEADLVIDLNALTGDTHQAWKNLAQGGEEPGKRMLLPVIEQTRSLDPEYIRIDHIYDYYDVVSRDGAGNLVFNWSELDLTVQDILATGALPFFSLSYMPPVIARNGGVTDMPRDMGEWQFLVQNTIEHYSGRFGMNLNNVYYEVWNEPDLFGGFKNRGSEKNYMDLYFYSSLGAQNAQNVNSFKFGGPATTAFYPGWFERLFSFVRDNQLRLDFFSWHRYGYDMSEFTQDMYQAYSKAINEYPEFSQVEFLITETGHDPENDDGYDTDFGAIHTLATVATVSEAVDRMFIFEIKDGPGENRYWGRWGLLTNEKHGLPVPKSRFNAVAFANQMDGEIVQLTGEGTWVKALAMDDEERLQILVVNYDAHGKHAESVPISFVNLPNGNFTFTREDYGRGVVKTLQLNQVETTWSTQEYFEPNTASIFELKFN